MLKMRYSDLTDQIIKAFYQVYNTLGYGFLEKVYENALVMELRESGLKVTQQATIQVFYRGREIGVYHADLLVEDLIILELKSVRALAKEHEAQLLNYLKSTPYEVGLLLNFGPRPQVKRKVFDNDRKGAMSWTEPNQRNEKVKNNP